MGLRIYLLAALWVVTLVACANFPYKWYILESESFEGKLIGAKPKDDLPLDACKSESNGTRRCIVVFKDEFERMQAERIDLIERLKSCEGHKE